MSLNIFFPFPFFFIFRPFVFQQRPGHWQVFFPNCSFSVIVRCFFFFYFFLFLSNIFATLSSTFSPFFSLFLTTFDTVWAELYEQRICLICRIVGYSVLSTKNAWLCCTERIGLADTINRRDDKNTFKKWNYSCLQLFVLLSSDKNVFQSISTICNTLILRYVDLSIISTNL